MEKIKLILDTDIGDDIDDAFALALAASLTKLDIIGVTTVFKHTIARGKMVKRLLDLLGKNQIPVYAGSSNPLKEPIHYFAKDDVNLPEMGWPCQYDETYDSYSLESEDAVDFITRQASLLAGELVLVPIGPLTNIAQAIQREPAMVRQIKKIVLMGGDTDANHPEWNIYCDPEAADIVFQSGIPIELVGLNVTMQCVLDEQYLASLSSKTDAISRELSLWLRRWAKYFHHKKSVMHDPLAIATLVENVCHFEKRFIKVDLTDVRGATIIKDEPFIASHEIKVAISVEPHRFNQLLVRYVP